jgi:hypothetical protein
MEELDPAKVVATGPWLYDGTVPCRVFIQREEVWPAFYDPEDDPNAEDKIMPCVSVWYESPCGGCTFAAGGGYYHTVAEGKTALAQVVRAGIEWKA